MVACVHTGIAATWPAPGISAMNNSYAHNAVIRTSHIITTCTNIQTDYDIHTSQIVFKVKMLKLLYFFLRVM